MVLPLDSRGVISDRSMSMAGKRVIVTGATQGIGKETTAALAGLGAHVILAARNLQAAQQVAKEIKEIYPYANVIADCPALDLSSQQSVRDFAQWYINTGQPLHVLVNNAGAIDMDTPSYTDDGIGMLCQINYLGPYTLTRLLEERLVQSAPSRIVNVSSVMHRFARIGNPATFLTNWKQGSRYMNTKLANAIFAFELHRRLSHEGVNSCAVDPGGVASSIWRNSVFSRQPLKFFIDNLYAPPYDGCAAVVHACTVDWEEEREIARKVNEKCNPNLFLSSSSGSRGRNKERDMNDPEYDLRFYARGAFTSPAVTQLRGIPGQSKHKLVEKVRQGAAGFSILLHSMMDWPLRRATGLSCMTTTVPVAAAPLAYNIDLSKAVWEVSADAIGVPFESVCSR